MRPFESRRLAREQKTVLKMIALYCRHHHHKKKYLCDECNALAAYAENRLRRCMYAAEKPACSECQTHCYQKEKRDKIRNVMRYAGPRMIFHSPYLAIMHVVDKIKSTG